MVCLHTGGLVGVSVGAHGGACVLGDAAWRLGAKGQIFRLFLQRPNLEAFPVFVSGTPLTPASTVVPLCSEVYGRVLYEYSIQTILTLGTGVGKCFCGHPLWTGRVFAGRCGPKACYLRPSIFVALPANHSRLNLCLPAAAAAAAAGQTGYCNAWPRESCFRTLHSEWFEARS